MVEALETAAVVALLRHGKRPWHEYVEMIESAGSALAVVRGEYKEPGDGRGQTLFDDPVPALEVDLDAIAAEVELWRAEMQVLTVLDDDYPENLRTIHNRPPLLFVAGNLERRDDDAIAVVGTRQPSEAGLAAAAAIAGDIAAAGFTVVSGLAAGIDAAAHSAALERGGRTVAVIGTGLRRSYPAQNKALQQRLASEAAVVSQFWPDAPPRPHQFPMRNIVMSGLALATVVIEASHTSGAKMQARFALEHGRPVFLHRSLLEHSWARDYAERPGTHVIESAAEVLEQVERLTRGESLVY
jgi:DNA processing protein